MLDLIVLDPICPKYHEVVPNTKIFNSKGLFSHSHSGFDSNRNSISLLKYQKDIKCSAEIFFVPN